MSTLTQFFSMGGGGGMTGQAFTAPGTWTSPSSATAATFYAVGGGGGATSNGGGGGATNILTKVIAPSTGYPVTIGAGGAGTPIVTPGNSPGIEGGRTVFNGVYGLGGGAAIGTPSPTNGSIGGGMNAIISSVTPFSFLSVGPESGPILSSQSFGGGAISYGMGLSGASGGTQGRNGGTAYGVGGTFLGGICGGGGSWGDGGNQQGTTANNSGGGGGGGLNGTAGGSGGPGYAQVIW